MYKTIVYKCTIHLSILCVRVKIGFQYLAPVRKLMIVLKLMATNETTHRKYLKLKISVISIVIIPRNSKNFQHATKHLFVRGYTKTMTDLVMIHISNYPLIHY